MAGFVKAVVVRISTLAFSLLILYNQGMKLTERQKEILKAIIEEYAETASPVGSIMMAKLFEVSPATIRAEMARLESYGLIAQPHTSAGRVPTDAGYRYYVNSLNDGSIENAASIDRGTHALEVRVTSQSRADAAIRGAVDSLVELTGNLGLATIGGQLYIAGVSRLFAQPEFIDNARVQAVAKLLDNLEPWLRANHSTFSSVTKIQSAKTPKSHSLFPNSVHHFLIIATSACSARPAKTTVA